MSSRPVFTPPPSGYPKGNGPDPERVDIRGVNVPRNFPDVAICDPCRDGTCDDCAGWAWCEATSFVSGCDCKDSGHQLQRDIAEDEAADRALSAHYEETA